MNEVARAAVMGPGFPVVGMVGAGQLARMSAAAAVGLGVGFSVLARSADESAAQVSGAVVLGDHDNEDVLREFASDCDVITFDHEHVPPSILTRLQGEGVVVRPGPEALVHAQDKVLMRERLSAAGLPCPAWQGIAPGWTLEHAGALVESFAAGMGGWPVVLKTARGGYDGRGVFVLASSSDAVQLLERLAPDPVELLLEERVGFTRELAAVVARSPSGQAVAYPVVRTTQRDGICHEVVAPCPDLDDDTAVAAQQIALQVAELLGVTGVLAVELFDTVGSPGDPSGRPSWRPSDGPWHGLLVNELAMRPHNSGHWSIEGAVTSQFENHLRAVLDLPLGDPRARSPWTVMVNVLPTARPEAQDLYRGFLHCMAHDPGVKVHMYGKQVRPGRKVGHVTVTGSDLAEVTGRAHHAAAFLAGEIDS